jgi:hypothetical protein
MCLLITQNENSDNLGKSWLADFFNYNADGVGVMYADKGQLHVIKSLPRTAKDLTAFYRSHIMGRACAWHLRMRTHGNTDLANCHPYEVLNAKDHGLNMWLMHNGVLHTGNAADPKMSDTFHFIADYLRPMLENNPDLIYQPGFQEILGAFIGRSNKLVLLDDLGRMATINKSAGVNWRGHWLSNTYAWTAPVELLPRPKYVAKTAAAVPDYDAWADTSWGGKDYYYS